MHFTISQMRYVSPREFKKYIPLQTTSCSYYATKAGVVQILSNNEGVYAASFVELPAPQTPDISQNLDLNTILLVGTPFEVSVWNAVFKIPEGKTSTYAEIANAIGKPLAWRAVARAIARNKIAYFVPCHRVVCKNGNLGGYRWGVERKKTLLSIEQISCS